MHLFSDLCITIHYDIANPLLTKILLFPVPATHRDYPTSRDPHAHMVTPPPPTSEDALHHAP